MTQEALQDTSGVQAGGLDIRTKRLKAQEAVNINSQALQAVAFPDISLSELKKLPYSLQKNLIARNRIVNTDTYNRTMNELSGKLIASKIKALPVANAAALVQDQATYALQLRRSPFNYLVACGIEDMIEDLTLLPISRAELNFAKEYYRETKVPFFDEEMWRRVVEDNQGKLPFEIYGVRDGTIVLPGEPLFTVKGPEELIAHFEHVFHRVFYSTLVATRAHVLSEIIGDPGRFVEVGKRGAITEEQHLQAIKAMYIGGGFTLTSNDAGSVILPLRDTGTIGHRYVQRFTSEEAAFRHAIEILDTVTLLIDLVDSYRGIDLGLKLKQEYRASGKRIWMRLDSGDILDQVRYFLRKTEELGFTDENLDRVIVEGIDSFDEIAKIEKMIIEEFGKQALKRVIYGAGGLLISEQTSRSDASSGFKICEYTDENGQLQPTMKFSNSPGKISYPGGVRLVITAGQRVLAQAEERLAEKPLEMFEPLYAYGERAFGGDRVAEARERLLRQAKLLEISTLSPEQLKALRATPSPETQDKIDKLHWKYGLAA